MRLDMVSMQLAQMMSGQDYKLLKLDENGDFVFDKDNNPVTIDMPAVRISFGGGDCRCSNWDSRRPFTSLSTPSSRSRCRSTSRVRSHRRAAAWTSIQAALGGNLVAGFAQGSGAAVSAAYAAKYQYSGRVEPPAQSWYRCRRLRSCRSECAASPRSAPR